MKDQYVGDINDFAKYQLLRLAETHFSIILIAWMLTKADGRRDGGQTSYLTEADSGQADPELHAILSALVSEGRRSITALETSGALPGCGFHSLPLPTGGAEREGYFRTLSERAGPNTLVFFDPDNGLEVRSVSPSANGAERYLFWNELRLLRNAGSSVLIYQHFPRVQRAPYLKERLTRLRSELGDSYEVFAAHTSQVGFLFGLRRESSALRDAVITRCADSPLLNYADSTSTRHGRPVQYR